MRILAIGDLHGRGCWKKIDPSHYERIIFIGDYVDSLRIPPAAIRENLEEVIEFKKNNSEKVILLLGNHDIQYSEYPKYRCSGFNAQMQVDYAELFRKNEMLFQVAWQTENYLFTHAGLSTGFAQENLFEYNERILSGEVNVADVLNHLHRSDEQYRLHTVSALRGGSDAYGGITWADYRETSKAILPGYHQVVGHTPKKEITREGDGLSSITYIDVLGTKEEFYELALSEYPA